MRLNEWVAGLGDEQRMFVFSRPNVSVTADRPPWLRLARAVDRGTDVSGKRSSCAAADGHNKEEKLEEPKVYGFDGRKFGLYHQTVKCAAIRILMAHFPGLCRCTERTIYWHTE